VTTPPSPVSAPNPNDPGDDTARRYRYQHAYGVILWVAGYRKALDYQALWCEQHEDFLGQVDERMFDAYQIKTREAESGYWDFGDKALYDSLARFVELDEKYPGQIRHFYFVSNAQCSKSSREERRHLCPGLVLKACADQPLPDFCEKALQHLVEKTGCKRDALLSVLKRTVVQPAPALTSIDAEVIQNHFPPLDGLASCSSTELGTLLNRLLSRVRDASSLAAQDPARHYPVSTGGRTNDAQLRNKRIGIDELTGHLEYLRLLTAREPAKAQVLSASIRRDATGLSPMTRLIVRYKTETENDQKVKRLIEQLQKWHERPPGDVMGLEEKLRRGNRPDMIDFAMLAKERFARALGRHEYSPAAQEIYAYLLAQMWVIFSELIFTKISQGASPEAVNLALLNEVYPRIEILLEDNPLGIDPAEIRGMLFWLTGNCHVKWAPDANLQPSV
jgi:hypothetical protein